MKSTLLILGLCLSFSAFSHDAKVIVSHSDRGISLGFVDSSFYYPHSDEMTDEEIEVALKKTKFCYEGQAQFVCGHIGEQVYKINSRYSQGAHDRLDLLSCVLEEQSRDGYHSEGSPMIVVQYTLSDDYNSTLGVKREINKCPDSL